MGKKTIVSLTCENRRISIKNSLPYIKCVLRLSWETYLYFHLLGPELVPVVRMVDKANHWINLYPVDNAIDVPNTYPLDSDLSSG